MHGLAMGVALVLAVAIMAIRLVYVASPAAATGSFGLPPPDHGPNTAWWLRLKGVRDIVSGLAVLAFMTWSGPPTVGLLLLVEATIPIGDMLVILAAKGSVRSAFGIHGLTALVMIGTAVPLTWARP